MCLWQNSITFPVDNEDAGLSQLSDSGLMDKEIIVYRCTQGNIM